MRTRHRTYAATWAGLGLVLLSATATRAADPPKSADIQEFVLGVSRIDQTLPAFTEALKWEVKHRGPASPEVVALWGLPKGTEVSEVLVGDRKSTYGFVRLVEIRGVERDLIRLGAKWWDTGGIANINFLVKSLDQTIASLRLRGFTADTPPTEYVYPGDRRGRMTMMRGPDDMVLSFQQRISPPLTTFGEFEGATHIEIGYQVVKDLEAWRRFHAEILGFAASPVNERKTTTPVGPNDYGLPQNLIGVNDGKTVVVKTRESGEQGIGGRQFLTSTGYDNESKVKPQNLGITAMRLAVADVDAFARRIKDSGIALETEPSNLELPPYGNVRIFSVRTPGGSGARIEFHSVPAHGTGSSPSKK